MKESFIEKRFGAKRLGLIGAANKIVEKYLAAGYRLTLRQLFYQLVVANLLRNVERSYKILGEAISDGRLAGLIDWEAIEDRIRQPFKHPEFENLEELVKAALQSYRLPRWADQEHYVELWVEKDALAGVLRPLALAYHVTLMVNRGYSSQSAMYEAANRFEEAEAGGKETVLLYLGDHDPSGEDMVRDIRARLERFGANVDVQKIALTMAQVKQYNPPPNPAKMSDSRAASYVAEHGASSWEVDALPPDVLHKLIERSIHPFIDGKAWDRVVKQEEQDKKALTHAVKGLS